MTYRALLSAALVLSLGAASVAPSAFGRDSGAALVVRAGVGGAARPGRWLPVDVTVSSDAALRGSLVVEWGGAIARRDVDIASSSSNRVTVLLRTISATPAVDVTLVDAAGKTIATTTTAITLLPVDDNATLCIGEVVPATICAARIRNDEAPRNWRGFDLADEVVWNAGSSAPLEAAKAFAVWQATRWWQNGGFVDPVAAPFDTDSRLADRTSLTLAAFVVALLLLSGLTAWLRAPAIVIAGVPLMVAVAGLAFVSRSSRDVDMQEVAFVHQFAGVAQSVLFAKGEVEHPGAAAVELTPDIADASLDIIHGLQYSDGTTSIDGRPVYRNTSGRGVRQRFELSGTLDRDWLAVTHRESKLIVENRSTIELRNCQLRSGETVDLGSIPAGRTIETAAATAPVAGDAIVCSMPSNWLTWSAHSATVSIRGHAFLIFHFWPGPDTPTMVANAPR